MAFNEVRQNFASRPLFSGDLGRDLDELERRAGSSSVANNANNPSSSSLQRNYQNNSRSNSSFNNNNNNMMSPGTSSYYNNNNNNNSARTPLADHHHLGSSSNARGGGGNTSGGPNRGHPQVSFNRGGPQVSFISSPSAPIPYGHNNTSGATTNNTSSFMTVSGNNNNNNYGSEFSPASQQQQQHNVRGPSNSGAWSLLPPQIPRPLGLQRFLDEQFAPPPMMQHQGGGSRNNAQQQQGVDGNGNQQQQQYNNNNKPESIGRSSGATYNRSNPTTPTPSAQKQNNNNKSANKSSRRARTPAGQYQGDYGAGRGPYGMMNSTDEDEFGDVDDFDPIATGARHRREQIENEINIHSATQGVGEFAQSLGIGTAEAVAARMAAEVARQAAQKPNFTADDLQSNHSNSTKDAAATARTGGPRASEVAIMRRRMERIDDGLARAAMRQQLAQERLKNVVASGLVAEGGSQTDMNMAPLDTGAKPRSNLLVDPSALDPASVGGSTAAAAQQQLAASGAGGGDQTEQELEAVAKMNMMKKSGLLLMPAVPYEHFKYVAPEVSSSMMSKREQEEKARKNPGQAKAEAKDALKDRLDQLELAHEELLIRNRIVPTQPDQYGSNRPHKDQNVDPTSVLASIDPRDQLAASPENSRAPKPDTIDKTIDHAASAYRLQHQKIAAPVGGYGSVMDPRSQTTQETAAEEQRRWALAKARNEAEGMSFTSTGTGGPLGASATAQLRNQQDDTGLMANASLRTLPSGNQRDAYDARKKWSGVSFENPGSNKFQGTHMEAISKESRDLYGFDATQ